MRQQHQEAIQAFVQIRVSLRFEELESQICEFEVSESGSTRVRTPGDGTCEDGRLK